MIRRPWSATDPAPHGAYAEAVKWPPAPPRFRPLRLALALLVGAVAVSASGLLVAGVHVESFAGALLAAALIGVLNAILPPIVAALRLPYTLVLGFLVDFWFVPVHLLLVSEIISRDFEEDSIRPAL